MRRLIAATAMVLAMMPIHPNAANPGNDRLALSESVTISNQNVPLLTSGTRKELWVDVYRCGIYTRQEKTLTRPHKGAALAIAFLVQTDLLPDAPPRAWRASLAKSITPTQYATLAKSFATLDPGEQLMFVHRPGSGTSVTLDGEELFSVEHDSLIETVLEMLVGRDPVSADLKEQLIDKAS